MPTCKSWMKYSWEGHICENPPWEADPEGLCILHSLVPEKDKNAFDQALQAKLAGEDYDFREVYFPGPVSFAKQKFTGGHFLAAFSHFLIVGQAALFILAIRNRLGRRH